MRQSKSVVPTPYHPDARAIAWDEFAVCDFWRFVARRQQVFVRRVLWREPPPWTDDPILAGTFFTNVYRELDRGTRFAVREVLAKGRTTSFEDVLANVVVYRLFNWPPTYEALGGFRPVGGWEPTAMEAILRDRQAQGAKVFTGAHRISQVGAPSGLTNKISIYVDAVRRIQTHMPAVAAQVRAVRSLQDAHTILTTLPRVGDFVAYEIVSDLLLSDPPLVPFSLDDWCHLGNGAQAGLKTLVGDRWHARSVDAVRVLRDTQVAGLARAGVTLWGPTLTLRDVEHSLCEYSKYVRARDGGHRKRTFDPAEATADLSPWDDLPPRFRLRRWPV